MRKEAKFILDKPKSNIETFIFLKFSCNDTPLRFSTQEKILPSNWDADLQRTKKDRNINSELDRLYRIVQKFIESQRLLGNKYIYKEALKKELQDKSGRPDKIEVIKDKNDFNTAFQILLKEARGGTLLTAQKKIYSKESIDVWEQGVVKLNLFIPKLKFSTVNMETYNLILVEANKRNFTKNYTGNIIKVLKTIMEIAFCKGWHNNAIHRSKDFKTLKEKSFQVYLNEQEIKQIYNLDLSEEKFREVIRDRFIINLYTGLRVSDMKTLSVDNIHNDAITHINKKTTKKVVIPVHDLVNTIIEKYNGVMPHQYNEKIVNREIKLIAKDAGLTEKIRYSKTIGGVTVNFVKEKWEMITNHTSRRSMATNLLKHVKMQEAMPVMGMSIETLQHYNKITAEDNAENIKSNPFFKN